MSEVKRGDIGTNTRKRGRGRTNQPMFYGGLKSNNELYFQMASLYKEVTRGSEPLAGQWIDRIMALHRPDPSGKFF